MDMKTEIRKLRAGDLFKLYDILDDRNSWIKLMSVIPQTLSLDCFECHINANNPSKYTTEHIHLIERASELQKRRGSEILFEEWGTSGRVRPRLGHLLHFLTTAQLFWAADCVADLLKVPHPERPAFGPAARVVNDSFESDQTIIRNLNQISYPSSLLSAGFPSSKLCVPKIAINDEVILSDVDNNNVEISDNSGVPSQANNASMVWREHSLEKKIEKFAPVIEEVVTESTAVDLNSVQSRSDMIKFSEINDDFLPDFGALVSNTSDVNPIVPVQNTSANQFPSFSQLLDKNPTCEEIGYANSNEMPAFSQILDNDNLSLSNNMSTDVVIQNNSRKSSISPVSSHTTCASPLPNLSLNTVLPHFTYQELDHCTAGFEETMFDSAEKGRKLGSGAFGSVYLAVGLIDQPVAVKKLFLNGVEVVNMDDTITKQFRNEVEVLCKYKHPNLLSLLGYSCDGPTYCLIYEYVSGGALKDRLQSSERPLQWQERLKVSLGTARAVSYLHNAHKSPLIHRDIKSANILLDGSNQPKLGDFGLIKLTPSPNTVTGTTVFGTSAYMAPEAFRGDVSVKLDTFSFGVVLLELLTGLAPFDENREGHDLVTHVFDVYEESKDFSGLLDHKAGNWRLGNVNFSDRMLALATRCLESMKVNRPTMVDVVVELTQITDDAI